ncbi:acyl-CoA synthetase (AMP-forming)/AMP-acid ligase II [Kribbella orskensis]|uniref:Acyl-CoA synthetase (AMP-forming)/AMP-acid ligase II n=1 Tax=Kribbella orskensis TaxID=2512216 RepID=A0ABY2BA30_9ACTN|nr:acyl-CoA synthetase (AMP-forming)/AMP-acid ligase II [Kribbella sp. VKM Ac-2500]TCO13244.1 acyl-CoA synthetase (AMP-forming)/AMP-acid ligase II [Kribbella orskensis]
MDEVGQIAHWIQEASEERGNAVYLADARSPRRVRYRDLTAAVADWDKRLTDADVPPGATVATAVTDPLDAGPALLGLVATGRVAAPFDPAAPRALDRRRAEPDTVAVLTDNGLERLANRVPTRRPAGVLLSSSGSTGEPKQVLLSDAQLAYVATAVADSHQLGPADVGYCPLPLYHVNAEVVGLLATLRARGRLVLDRRFSRSRFWATVDAHEATWVNAVPAIVALLAEDGTTTEDPARIRFVRSASAPLPVPVLRRFEDMHHIPVLESYGMTEAASQITVNPLDGERRPGSVGLPVGGELKVVGDDRREQPAGEPGTVLIRGPGVIRAYATDVGAERFDAEGWLDTGDLGRLDEDGYLWLVGRSGELINRSGEKILPREIEDVLREDPGVRDAVVVGRPDPVLGEVPVAYVVASTDDPGLPDRLAERCRAALPRDRRPAELTVVEQLPITGTGKVRRAEVAEMVRSSGLRGAGSP